MRWTSFLAFNCEISPPSARCPSILTRGFSAGCTRQVPFPLDPNPSNALVNAVSLLPARISILKAKYHVNGKASPLILLSCSSRL